mmetsp:Transcript_78430/g.224750  ORF Transcript_78430/g.224750 Transcript_78430/m.224750 type:complete len:250 (-) Transcript_78430:173-922(-)
MPSATASSSLACLSLLWPLRFLELTLVLLFFKLSPACRSAQEWGVSSDTQMKQLARASSATITSFFMASSSQGTAASKVTPSCSCASLWTPLRALDGSSCHNLSSRPPDKAINCTRASPAAARTFECSLDAARSNNGKTNARRNRPDCCKPNAESHRPSNFKFAAKHFGPKALSFDEPPFTSAVRRSSIRFNKGHEISSKGTRPWRTQEQRASAAACCGDKAVLEPPPASVWSRSTSKASLSFLPWSFP